MTTAPLDLAAALRDPGRHFAEPQDILEARGLDRATKLDLLDQWEHDARALAVAEEEGLGGGETTMLARIRHARRALGADDDRIGSAAKHG